MLIRAGLCVFAAFCLVGVKVSAADKNGKSLIQVLHAYEQSTTPGTPGATEKGYQFVVVWKGSESPRQFMWRGASDLVLCKVQRAHRNTVVKPGEPSAEYMGSFIAAASSIVKYDTLLITPLAGRGAFRGVLPSAKVRRALYFSTGEKNWFYSSIKNFEKKQPIMMP